MKVQKTVIRKIAIAVIMTVIMTGCFKKETAVTEPETVAVTTENHLEENDRESEKASQESSEEETEKNVPEETEEITEAVPEEKEGAKIMIVSDLHYLAEELTDKGENFTYMVEHGDGKLVNYIWELTDAFIMQVIDKKPDALILSGDLSFNGELLSHRELSVLLEPVEEAGIPVVVIPGNHDINCSWASFFDTEEQLPARTASPLDFETIYANYGYKEAVSRDPYSLSYTYQLTDHIRLLMLDSCQYEPENLVGGMIRTETYSWIEEQMENAWNEEMTILPVAHHNLLEESQIYTRDCTIEHSEQLVEILEGWGIKLFLSGHLHVQHYMNSQPDDTGVYEIVTSSLATPPCQYGMLNFYEDGSFEYYTEELDIEKWAAEGGYEDENLLNFKEYRGPFLSKVFYNQAYDVLRDKTDVPLGPGEVDDMSVFYAKLNSYYYAGKAYEIAEELKTEKGYALWQEYGYPSILMDYVEAILQEAVRDYNYLDSE